MLPEKPRKRPATFMRQVALAMELPFILVGCVAIGVLAGRYLLDPFFGTSPLFTLLLLLVGFAAGVREVLRRIPKDEKENGGG